MESLVAACFGPVNPEKIFSHHDLQVEGRDPFNELEGKYDLESIAQKSMGNRTEYALMIRVGTKLVPVRFTTSSGGWVRAAGSSLNIAMGLRALGVRQVALATSLAVGPHDVLSDDIRTYAVDGGVHILPFSRPTTPVTIIIVDGDGDEKKSIVLSYKPLYEVSSTEARTIVAKVLELSPTHVFATGIRLPELRLAEMMLRKVREARNGEVTTFFIPNPSILSPHQSEIRHLLKRHLAPSVDVWQVNQREAEVYRGIKAGALRPDDVQRIARSLKIPAFIVTRGNEGAWAVVEKKFYNIPAIEVPKVLDTTGAGDAHLLGLAAAMRCGCDEGQALRVAAKFGASNIMALGGHGGMPTYEKATQYIESVRQGNPPSPTL